LPGYKTLVIDRLVCLTVFTADWNCIDLIFEFFGNRLHPEFREGWIHVIIVYFCPVPKIQVHLLLLTKVDEE